MPIPEEIKRTAAILRTVFGEQVRLYREPAWLTAICEPSQTGTN